MWLPHAAQTAPASAASVVDALENSERQYRRPFEAAGDGILLLDSGQGRITDANPFMTELLGYSHAALLGKESGDQAASASETSRSTSGWRRNSPPRTSGSR
jgi:PAS domain S-box-containing protein